MFKLAKYALCFVGGSLAGWVLNKGMVALITHEAFDKADEEALDILQEYSKIGYNIETIMCGEKNGTTTEVENTAVPQDHITYPESTDEIKQSSKEDK